MLGRPVLDDSFEEARCCGSRHTAQWIATCAKDLEEGSGLRLTETRAQRRIPTLRY